MAELYHPYPPPHLDSATLSAQCKMNKYWLQKLVVVIFSFLSLQLFLKWIVYAIQFCVLMV